MRVFVVGATGLIGSHAARALVAAGHRVLGLARSDTAAATLTGWGVDPVPGDLADVRALAGAVGATEATVFAPAIGTAETAAVRGFLDLMAGTDKVFAFCSGTGVLSRRTAGDWCPLTVGDYDEFVPLRQLVDRVELENEVKAASIRGVRGIVVRPPAVWTHELPHVLVTNVVDAARETGAACHVGAGLNMYSNVHAEDLGEVFRLVVEQGRAGATYHAVAGEVPNRWIAETVARHLGVPVRSVTMDEAIGLWGKFFTLVVAGVSSRTTSERTREELGWTPRHLDMLASAERWLRARVTA